MRQKFVLSARQSSLINSFARGLDPALRDGFLLRVGDKLATRGRNVSDRLVADVCFAALSSIAKPKPEPSFNGLVNSSPVLGTPTLTQNTSADVGLTAAHLVNSGGTLGTPELTQQHVLATARVTEAAQ